MPKKSTRRHTRPKAKTNLVLPILAITIFLTALFGYLLYRSLITPIQIAEINSHNTSCPGFVEATISKTQVKPGEKFIVSCDYGRNDLDCIGTDSLPTSYNPCAFLTWDGTKAKWECTAQTNPGYYTQLCTHFYTDSCKEKNIPTTCQNFGVEYLVTNTEPITPPTKPVVTTKCVDYQPTGTISWDKAYSETWIDIATEPRHLNGFANKKVINQNQTDFKSFKTGDIDFEFKPETVYYAWVFNGSISEISEPFSFPNCIPKPTSLTAACSTDGTKATLKWDDVSPGKYHFAFNDPSNDTSSTWFIANTQDIWRGGDLDSNQIEVSISPAKEYRWSVESNLNGPSTPKSTTARSTVRCEPKPPAPTNPKLTCSPDGKSVKFSWDSVNSVESYKIRLDDKKGTVTNHDNIKDTQKVIEITPGQTYSWWMHSHQRGYDSNQTAAVDFACTPTATPSTPTPKPSIQPTPTPTPITYAIPSPKVLFDNTPSTPPTSNLADNTNPQKDSDYTPTPTPTTSTQKSTLLARFFTWLSRLFE